MEAEYQVVHTAGVHYGSPRGGIADFQGEPHEYLCLFDVIADDYSDVYLLRPIGEAEFRARLELHEISLRWQRASEEKSREWRNWVQAVRAGNTQLAVKPVLREDRQIRDSLEEIVQRERGAGKPGWHYGARAEFERLAGPEPVMASRWRVRWLRICPREKAQESRLGLSHS